MAEQRSQSNTSALRAVAELHKQTNPRDPRSVDELESYYRSLQQCIDAWTAALSQEIGSAGDAGGAPVKSAHTGGGSSPPSQHHCVELIAPPGLLPAEQLEYWRELAHELYAIAKRYAAECRLCGGCGVRRRLDVDGVPLDDVACEHCADARLAIACAEDRSDE